MINKRLEKPEYRKYFNLLQFISFSNNMEYEDDDNVDVSIVKAGSFYTTPNGEKTSFSFFREDDKEYHKNYPYKTVDEDLCKDIIKDLGYDPDEYDTAEFKVNNDPFTPCNRFITSMYDKERFLFILRYGLLYVKGATPKDGEGGKPSNLSKGEQFAKSLAANHNEAIKNSADSIYFGE